MRTGDLDQRIRLLAPDNINNNGSLTVAYVEVAEVWGAVSAPRGNEAFEAGRTNARETIRLKLRWRNDVKSDWAIEWFGQRYNVTHVDRSLRRHGELWLNCEIVGAK